MRAPPPALERPPAAPGSGGATRRASRSNAAAAGSADALAAAAEEAAPDALPPPRRADGGEGGTGGGEGGKGDGGKGVAKPLLPLQYQVFYFGVKSVPGSLAFFVGSLAAALGWAALFRAAGHYGPDFSMAAFAAAAALCIGVATVAEAISPPHVDNLLVTCAAAACHPRASPLMTSSCIAPCIAWPPHTSLHTDLPPASTNAGTPRPPAPSASPRAESRPFCCRAARER